MSVEIAYAEIAEIRGNHWGTADFSMETNGENPLENHWKTDEKLADLRIPDLIPPGLQYNPDLRLSCQIF